ncbi:MAG: 4-hydroxybenzoyl-CoA thioesterase [Frankiales bacterium]|nr:4-hydroxybenzoyl-CoA thioesterase [Frankiales bacterium]
MLRHSSTVTDDDIRPLTQEVDPTAPGYGNHLSFDAILRRCGLAWTVFLNSLDGFGAGVIVPRVSVDYLSEVDRGSLDIDVAVTKVGTSSFTILCAVTQDGRPCANVDVVLVSFDYDGRSTRPLTAGQRAQLEAHVAD